MHSSPEKNCYRTGLCLFLWLMLTSFGVSAGTFEQGLLWKVESSGHDASYLFGTIHLEDERVTRLPAPVRQAFDGADAVTLEMVMDPMALINMSMAMMLTDGRDLRAIVGDRLYQRVIKAMAARSMPEMVVAQMKPWAVATTLITPESSTGAVLDMQLYQQAVAAGKTVDGLESAEEQMQVFDGMSEKLQTEMLQDTLDNLVNIQAQYQTLLEAWLQRDLGKLMRLNQQYLKQSSADVADSFNRRVIVDRNHRMAERIESRLKKGNHFIAVGALHLPGEEGLLNLLSQRGYRLSRVY